MLAAMTLGVENEWTEAARTLRTVRAASLPPEPLRYIGGLAVQAAVARKQRAEEMGRRPAWIAQALSHFVPGGVIDKRA
jgi:hypothetical protein